MHSKKIGITGGSGLLGKLLIKKLKIRKVSYSLFKKNILNQKDIIEWLSKENKIEYIFHFAAYASATNSTKNKINAYNTNVIGTENLIKSINIIKKKKIIFFSSSSHVYDYSIKPIKENYNLKPISFYGKTKFLAEKKILNKKYKYHKYFIARIFSVYHKLQRKPFLYPVMKDKLKKIKSNKIYVKGANNIRDFLNAEKLVEIILRVFDKKLTGIYNIGSGKGITVREFINKNIDENKIIIDNKKPNSLIANISKIKRDII
jgi:UDP-glucose 4-epimerase